MNGQQFDELLHKFTDEVCDTLSSKGDEYVPEGEEVSRFHNFNVSAAFNQQLSTEALWGMLTKHLTSLADMVKKDSTDQPIEKWDEKIGDAVAYLILLKGIVTENDQIEAIRMKAATVGISEAVYGNVKKPTYGASQQPPGVLIHHTEHGGGNARPMQP